MDSHCLLATGKHDEDRDLILFSLISNNEILYYIDLKDPILLFLRLFNDENFSRMNLMGSEQSGI